MLEGSRVGESEEGKVWKEGDQEVGGREWQVVLFLPVLKFCISPYYTAC